MRSLLFVFAAGATGATGAAGLVGLHPAAAAPLNGVIPEPLIAEWRSLDGSGNNPAAPAMGQAGAVMGRISTEAYADGASVPRGGSSLPSARSVSNAAAAESDFRPSSTGLSNMFWQWGQFVDHDITLVHIGSNEPLPIAVPTGDPWFDPFGTGRAEIGFERSEFVVDQSGVRQHANAIAAWIDGSQVYGSSEAAAALLREGEGGRLHTGANGLLPDNPHMPGMFLAGDERVNEQIGLTAMHTLWLREHNRIADLIVAQEGLDPLADDEKIFQRARAVVAAEMQAITYNEWLPLLLGPEALAGPAGYDPGVDAGIVNEFATAAFRFGHTMLPDRFSLVGPGLAVEADLALRDLFFAPHLVREQGIDSTLRGLSLTAAQEIDPLLSDEVRNFLFGPPGAGGFDLAALNIQRGRDHGLPGLNQLRIDLGLQPHEHFLALTGGNVELAEALATLYGSVDAVDLWIGGLIEAPWGESLMGETFTRIIAAQFKALRDGDRFFYDWAFSPEDATRLSELRLADIVRANSGVGIEVGSAVFLTAVPVPPTALLIALWLLAGVSLRLRARRS